MAERKPKPRLPELSEDEITRLGQKAGLPSEWYLTRHFEEFPGAGVPASVRTFVALIIEYADKKRVKERLKADSRD